LPPFALVSPTLKSFFPQETFEALSVMSSHGLPKLIGVLTHLDLIKSPATLRAQKKRLKKRFWTEVYDGAKLFYLSGVMNGRYPDREILNLSRFISVAKFRPLTFRNSHSYLLGDRIEDLTPREEVRQNPKIDRKVAVWGYLRGIPMRAPSMSSTLKIHIPGAGVDAFEVSKLAQLADPCPLPTIESEKRRKLNEKHRLVHAPFSGGAAGLLGAGAVSFDGDRVWVNTAGNFTKRGEEDGENVYAGEGEKMVVDLQDVDQTLAERIQQSQVRLFANDSAPLALPQASSSTSKRSRRLAFGEDELQEVDDNGSDDGMEEGSEADYDNDDDEAGPALRNDSDDEGQNGDLAYDDASDSDFALDGDGDVIGR
jgi:ribosome biogenesis protein BMS1